MEDKFSSILTKVACYSASSFSLLLAKETGLFETLLNADEPLTSEQIGKNTNVKERYAREILGALTAIELVNLETNKEGNFVYYLQPEAKDALKGPGFSIAEMNFLRIFMARFDHIKEVVTSNKSGSFRCDSTFLANIDEHKKKMAPLTIEFLLKNVPGLKERLENGIDCVEYGCGNAYHFSVLASRFPNSNFTATDVSTDLIEPIKKRYDNITNLKFDVVNLNKITDLHYNKYDWVYVNDVIHDLPHPVEAMKEIKKTLKKPQGVFTYIDKAGSGSQQEDVGNLNAAFFYSVSSFVCIPESFQLENSEAHGASIGKDTAEGFAIAAGFKTTTIMMGSDHGLYIAQHE